jgi:hypothetical protein
MPRPGRFNPGDDPVPFVREAAWTPGPMQKHKTIPVQA